MATTDSNGLVLLQQNDPLTPLESTINTVTSSVSNALNANTRIFNVANQAARNTLATTRTPTAANPLFVWRQDTKVVEYNDGSGWKGFPDIGKNVHVTGSTVIRTASLGSGTGFNGSINFGVTFKTAPNVTFVISNARLGLALEGVSTTKCDYGCRNDSGASTSSGDVRVYWNAYGELA